MLLASSNNPSSFWKILKSGKPLRTLNDSFTPSEWYQYFARMFKHRVVNYCTLDWQTAIETSSRCYHYNNFKTLLTIEKYLTIYEYSIKI